MKALAYVHVAREGNLKRDGGTIFDDKFASSLEGFEYVVIKVPVVVAGRVGLPFWARALSIAHRDLEVIRNADLVVYSHELTFSADVTVKPGCLIVHNYFSRFDFPELRVLELYYRIGGYRYYRRAFERAKFIFFLSHRELRLASMDFPDLSDRMGVISPPPLMFDLGPRRLDTVHVSGTLDWLPKRLSPVTGQDVELFSNLGLRIQDFSEAPFPCLAYIPDRFNVGFKLKLSQMLYCGDIIASRVDLSEEVKGLMAHYPFYRTVSSARDAAAYYDGVRRELSLDEIERRVLHANKGSRLGTWGDLAKVFFLRIDKQSGFV